MSAAEAIFFQAAGMNEGRAVEGEQAASKRAQERTVKKRGEKSRQRAKANEGESCRSPIRSQKNAQSTEELSSSCAQTRACDCKSFMAMLIM